MRRILQALSWTALATTIVPSVLYLSGRVDLPQTKNAMLLATIVWFIVTPLWMGREPEKAT
jgi:hypothetical protein